MMVLWSLACRSYNIPVADTGDVNNDDTRSVLR